MQQGLPSSSPPPSFYNRANLQIKMSQPSLQHTPFPFSTPFPHALSTNASLHSTSACHIDSDLVHAISSQIFPTEKWSLLLECSCVFCTFITTLSILIFYYSYFYSFQLNHKHPKGSIYVQLILCSSHSTWHTPKTYWVQNEHLLREYNKGISEAYIAELLLNSCRKISRIFVALDLNNYSNLL